MSNPWGSPQPSDPNQPFNPSFPPTADASGQPAYDYPAPPGPVYPGAVPPYPPPFPPQYAGGYPGGYPVRPPDQPQAVSAMVLGILGLVCCGLASPFAIWLGRKSLNEIDASGGMLGGRGQAQAGFIMGIIGTALWVLGVLFYVLVVALGVFAASKGQPTY
ncbi:MAG: DUF4190 domain-containing protein [Mycobacterium sp.]|mgnify:CR=1 FL=1